MSSAGFLKYARRTAGLSQAELGKRAGVSQTAISLIESGKTSPRFDTIERLLATCGFELEVTHRSGVGIDRSQMRELLRLSPVERARIAAEEARNLDKALPEGRR